VLERSRQLFAEAQRYIPGGVNSPVRSFRSVGGTPPFIARGRGARLEDVDGNRYIDYVMSWGPLILGHADPGVVAAVCEAAGRGTTYGAPTAAEVELARLICAAMPPVEMVRLVSSGTEATMSALRLARAATGRPLVVKFAGCYHGHVDALLVQAGSGGLTFGVPDSPGVTAAAAGDTRVLPYNDLDAVEALLASEGDRVAAVIVEPVAGNMGLVPPAPGFLPGLRRLCDRAGALLIFDEVITGFRVGWGGASALYGVRPDLVCLGKVIGGGFPLAAYGGRRELMAQVAPSGPVYQAGTLAGNPVAVAAGLATLRRLQEPGTYERLAELGGALAAGLRRLLPEAHVASLGSMFTVFFTPQPVRSLADALRADTERYARFFHAMLARGVYLPPSQFEVGFVSLAHTPDDVEATLAAAAAAVA
jgi:glutamate-1-semialdehyde 2,1-aminomutase